MSRYLANVFLEKTPKYLPELEAELKKTLKGHMSGTWKKPCFHTPYAWTFDDLCIPGEYGGEFFVEGSFWGPLEKTERSNYKIKEFFERIKPTSYVTLENASDEFLDDLIETGEVLLPDGSYVSDGKLSFGRQSEIEKVIKVKFSKNLLKTLTSLGGKAAAKNLIKGSDGALLLCEFREDVQ